jgi:hypothetical protein
MNEVTIKKFHLLIWLETTKEEILRLQNAKDYVNEIYYKQDLISYTVHEDLTSLITRKINENKTAQMFIEMMVDFCDEKRLDTLIPFKSFDKPLVSGLGMDITSNIRGILLTPSTEYDKHKQWF